MVELVRDTMTLGNVQRVLFWSVYKCKDYIDKKILFKLVYKCKEHQFCLLTLPFSSIKGGGKSTALCGLATSELIGGINPSVAGAMF